jgi:hypothetical protein
MLISAFVYLSEAIGMEMVGGWYFDRHNGQKDIIYGIITNFEESLEMIGLVIFLYALLNYVESVPYEIVIRLGATGRRIDP